MIMRLSCFVFCLAGSGNLACEQLTESQRDHFVLMVSAYMDQCIQGDDLLRSTCSRIRPHLSDKNKKYCEVSAQSFQQRTDKDYRKFQESFHLEIENNEKKIDLLMNKTREAFDKQFAQLWAGKVSMLDLESLHRFLGDDCLTIEREWLHRTKQ